jgi:predicted nucleic acid-binding protein
MNVVDTSGWLEYFANGPNAAFFATPINKTAQLLIPTLSVYEVFKRIHLLRGEGAALQAIAVMQEGQIVDLDRAIALSAAKLSLELKLPMADSVILATAHSRGATLWTQDADFETLAGVQYIAKLAL